MYRHNSDIAEEDENDDKRENDDERENDAEKENDDVRETDDENDDNEAEITFFNPSQSDSETEGKENNKKNDDEELQNDASENSVEELMKCEFCGFETKDKRRFKKHQLEMHSVKGKYVCCSCREEFDNRKFYNHGCNPFTVDKVAAMTTV